MINIKNSAEAQNSELLQAYLTETDGKVKETVSVGESGYQLGSIYTPTAVSVVSRDIKGRKAVYFGIETAEGPILSLKNLMGVTSLSGYLFQGTANSVSRNEDGEAIEIPQQAEILQELPKDAAKLKSELFSFNTTDLYQVVIDLENDAKLEKPKFFSKKLQYCGKALKVVTARKAAEPDNFDQWKAGDQRVIATQLWRVVE